MGKTVRYAPDEKQSYRKQKRNNNKKGLPSVDQDYLDFAMNEESWHPDIEVFDVKAKKNKNKWKSEKNKIKRKYESNWQEFDDDEFFEEYY